MFCFKIDGMAQYALALINIWETSFGLEHVTSLGGMKLQLKKVIKNYSYRVYNKTKKKKKAGELKSKDLENRFEV